MNSSRSVITSLRGRIWLAAVGLAIVNCLLGLGAYLVLSFLSFDPTITLLSTFILLTVTTLGFGAWMSKDLLLPIEEVALLARSMERSPSSTLPRTTGATETDQLLQTLHRSSQQIRNLISVMDEVAAGRTEAATIPLEGSDKLTASFQKLVSKVTDSISAKHDLDELQKSVTKLAADVAKVRGGQLDIDLRTDQAQTKDIAEAVRFLASRLSGVTKQIVATTLEGERAAAEAQASLRSGLEAIDQRSIGTSLLDNRTDDTRLEALLNELATECRNSSRLYDQYVLEHSASAKLTAASEQLRNGVAETNRLIQKLRNRSAGVSQLARLAQDLSKRSSLVALNASISSNGSSSPAVLVSEIENLAGRSEELHKQIILAGETLNSEIAGIEREVAVLADTAPAISRTVSGGANLSHSLSESIVHIAEIEKQVRESVDASKLESDKLKGIVQKLADSSGASAMVRESESSVQRLSGLLEGLRDSVSDLKMSGGSLPLRSASAPVLTPAILPEPTKLPGTPSEPVQASSFDMFIQRSAEPSVPSEPELTLTGFETLIDMSNQFGELKPSNG
jgi:methyl-accepting chemotaxis protein